MKNMPEQIAEAYLKLARANHYMLQVDMTKFTPADMEDARQELIRLKNALVDPPEHIRKRVDLAFVVLESDMRARGLNP